MLLLLLRRPPGPSSRLSKRDCLSLSRLSKNFLLLPFVGFPPLFPPSPDAAAGAFPPSLDFLGRSERSGRSFPSLSLPFAGLFLSDFSPFSPSEAFACCLFSRICLFCSSAFFFSVSASEIFLKRIGLPGAFTYSSSLTGSGSSALGSGFSASGSSLAAGFSSAFSEAVSAGFSAFSSGLSAFSAALTSGFSGASAFAFVSSSGTATSSAGFSSAGSAFGATGFLGITGLPIGGFGLAPSLGTTGTALILGLPAPA